MGNQQSLGDTELVRLEIAALQSIKMCDGDALNILNETIKATLSESGITIPAGMAPFDFLNNTTTDEPVKQHMKALILDKVSNFAVNNQLTTHFKDEQFMNSLVCIYGSNWILDQSAFKATDYTRNFFNVIANYSSGRFGTVLAAERNGMPFIIRTQNDARRGNRIVHESYIAIRYLNRLRKVCPNFNVIYGLFICGNPDGITGRICTGPTQVPYGIYEHIEGESLYTFMRNIQRKQLDPTLLGHVDPRMHDVTATIYQLGFALTLAHKAFKFSHRDLHTNNILMRPQSAAVWIAYDPNSVPAATNNAQRTIYYVKSSFIATLIDFETAEVYGSMNQDDQIVNDVKFALTRASPDGFDSPALNIMRDLESVLYSITKSVMLTPQQHDVYVDALVDAYLELFNPELLVNSTNADRRLAFADIHKENHHGLSKSQIANVLADRTSFDNFSTIYQNRLPIVYNTAVLRSMTVTDDQVAAREQQKFKDAAVLRSSDQVDLSIPFKLDQDKAVQLEIVAARGPLEISKQIKQDTQIKASMSNAQRRPVNYRLAQMNDTMFNMGRDQFINEYDKHKSEIYDLMATISFPIAQNFKKAVYAYEVQKYKYVIAQLFKLYRNAKELVILTDGATRFEKTKNWIDFRATAAILDDVLRFFKMKITPWKTGIDAILANSVKARELFGDGKFDMDGIFGSQFPSTDQLSFLTVDAQGNTVNK